MKKLLVSLFVFLTSIDAAAGQQQADSLPPPNGQTFSLELKGKSLYLKWHAVSPPNSYWKVQVSGNGKEFITIGLVMGEDPGEKNAYVYKHPTETIVKQFRLIRIQQILDNNVISSSASKIIQQQ